MAVWKIPNFLMATTAITLLGPLYTGQSWAGPEDGVITAGAASITQSGPLTSIHQSSDRAIIDWRSFNVGTSETVQFFQPGASSLTVNRINDSQISRIDGRVTANGQIMLLNQNGIIFGSSSQVDVAGLIASTGRINDAAFMSGAETLELTAGAVPNAAIINNGNITAHDAGLVGLVAPQVENNGIIQARLGRVTLAGASHVTLDLAGDELISIDITDQVNGSVKNSGAIIADGGTITLTASRARDAVETSIINTGSLQANSVSTRNGRIILSAGGTRAGSPPRAQESPAPAIQQAGIIQAASGHITVTGDSIGLALNSLTDASALPDSNADGGTIEIGGSYQGGDNTPTATWVTAEQGAQIKSNGDAQGRGNGGTIILWADRLMTFRSEIEAEGGDESGNGGFIEVSGKNRLIFEGDVSTRARNGLTGTLLLDPTNIEITAANLNVTGVSPFTPNADDVVSTLNAATLLAALAGSSVIVQTRATGSQLGDITVSSVLSWAAATTLTLDAHHDIIINQAITGPNLTLVAGNDIVVNAALTGTGTLTVRGQTPGVSIGLAGQAGTLSLGNTELAFLTNGWGNIIIGDATMTAGLSVGARAWLDNLTLSTGTGIITIAGAQTMGTNNLTITTDGSLDVSAALTSTGTGTLTISGQSASTTMGIGTGQAGTIQLTNAEVINLSNAWAGIVIGRVDGTGTINVGASSWLDPLTLRTLTGGISINGAQSMAANNLTITTDGNLNIGGALTGTGTLSIFGQSAATTMGIGTGQAGTIQFTDAEVTNLSGTWGSILLGRTNGTGTINVGTATWLDPLTIRTLTGGINITGTQTMGTNSLTINTDGNLNIGGTLSSTGTGTLTISGQSASTTMGIGTGQAGTIQLTNTEVINLSNAWAGIVIGRVDGTGAINVGASSWLDPLTLRTLTGGISINGAQSMATNSLNITTDGNLNIAAALTSTGTGTLSISGQSVATTIGIGTGQTGTIQLTDAEVTNLSNNWANINIGLTTGTGAINVGAATWLDPLNLRSASGVITIAGAQSLGANSMTITTNGNLAVNAAITGTGNLTIAPQTATTTIGLGTGQAGTLQLTDTEIANLGSTWSSLTIGSATGTGAMNVGALSWLNPMTLRTGTGLLTIAGTQTMGTKNLTLSTDSNLTLNTGANLAGSGILTITSSAVATTIGLGTGQTGTLQLNTTEISQINDGWNSIIIGNAAGTGALNIGALSWNDALTLRSTTGVMNVNGIQTMNAGNNLTLMMDSNMVIGASGGLTGTGNLVIQGNAIGTTIGLGAAQTGTLNLTDIELGRITNGWANLTFGQAGGTGLINIGAMNWTDNLTLLSNSGAININGAQTLNANNLTVTTNADPTFAAIITGTGTLTIQAQAVATTLGLAGGAGTLNLSTSDLTNALSGWSQVNIGRNDGTGAMAVGAYTWQYDTTLRTGTGIISISGAQTSTGNKLSFETDGNMSIGANISGSGTLTIRPSAVGTVMNIATGTTGLNITAAELNFIQDGWNNLVFGLSTTTGAVNIGARTWTDNVQFISGTGLMTAAAQTMNTATNLTFTTNSNLTLSGTMVGTGGILTIEGASPATGIGVGTGQAGTLVLDATDISRLGTTWGNGIRIGNSTATANINIGANAWTQPMTFLTNGNIILNGAQTSNRTSGSSLVFASLNGNFVNNTGSVTPITAGTGTARYLIYSVSAATDTYGPMTAPGSTLAQTYFSYGPASVVEAGNRIIYSSGAAKIIFVQIDNKTKVYGDIVPALTWTYLGGLQGADTLGAAITASNLTAAGALVGDNVGVTRSITGSYTTALGYTVSFTSGTLSVIKAPVNVQAVATSRAYGDTNPVFTINYTGLRNGDTSAVIDTLATASTTATALSNVGTYNITSSGAIDNNYVFSYGTTLLTVTKANLTITADDKARIYGDANPALTVSYSGFKNGETSAVIDTNPTISTAATLATGAGTAAITLAGGLDNNYNLILVNGTLTINKATLTATADNKTRLYGDANPVFTTVYTGFKNSDGIGDIDTQAVASTTATALSNVGSYGISISGASDANYNFIYNNGTLSVTPATLTVSADNQTRIYGDANPALTLTYTGFKNSDGIGDIDTLASTSTVATILSDAGSYTIGVSGASDSNYTFVYSNGTLTISKAILSVIADSLSRIYGDANPALTATYSGFKNGDTLTDIDSIPLLATGATVLSDAGTYAITLTGGLDTNYTLALTNGIMTVTKALLSAVADDQTRVYGDANPALTISYSGFKNGDTSADLDTLATASTTASLLSNAGIYSISTTGGTDNNYTYVYGSGQLVVSKANLTITADDQSREYGDANPVFSLSYSGFKNSDTSAALSSLPAASSTAVAGSDVGAYTIALLGGMDTNYTYILQNGTLTVTQAALTITADNQTREYGLTNPAFNISYSGFKNGDTASVLDVAPSVSTTAASSSNIGSYLISLAGGSDTNYVLNLVNGSLTVTPAIATVIADSYIRLTGAANPPLTYNVSGLRNGDTTAVITGLILSTPATIASVSGDYAITGSGASAANYTIAYVAGIMRVVDTLAPPIPSPESLPRTATRTLVNPSLDTVLYSALYNAPVPYTFMTTAIGPNTEPVPQTNNGYIPIYYYEDPFSLRTGDPLVFIDPILYKEKDDLDRLTLN